MKNRDRGSVEAVLCLMCFLALSGLYWEVARRAFYEIRAEWRSFELARDAIVYGPQIAQRRAKQSFERGRAGLAARARFRAWVEEAGGHERVVGRAYIRFPSLLQFPMHNGVKRGFQLVRPCFFSLH